MQEIKIDLVIVETFKGNLIIWVILRIAEKFYVINLAEEL